MSYRNADFKLPNNKQSKGSQINNLIRAFKLSIKLPKISIKAIDVFSFYLTCRHIHLPFDTILIPLCRNLKTYSHYNFSSNISKLYYVILYSATSGSHQKVIEGGRLGHSTTTQGSFSFRFVYKERLYSFKNWGCKIYATFPHFIIFHYSELVLPLVKF